MIRGSVPRGIDEGSPRKAHFELASLLSALLGRSGFQICARTFTSVPGVAASIRRQGRLSPELLSVVAASEKPHIDLELVVKTFWFVCVVLGDDSRANLS